MEDRHGGANPNECPARSTGGSLDIAGMKYCEIIADNLSTVGWSLGWVSAIDFNGRTIWITDAHRGVVGVV